MRYIFFAILVSTGAVAPLAATSVQGGMQMPAPGEALLALALVVLIALARRFPLHVAGRTRIAADISLIFAAILLFPLPWGPLVGVLGVLLGQVLLRRPLTETVIKTSVVVVQTCSTQWVYLWFGGTLPLRFDSALAVLVLLWAGYTMLLLDQFLADLVLSQRMSPYLMRLGLQKLSVKESAALLLLGFCVALLIHTDPWYLLLALPPAALVFLSARNSVRRELEVMTHEAVACLADLIERRDPYTAGHSMRVAELAERLAMEMGLPQDEIENIRVAGLVHDLGKMEVDARVLTKPGRLTDEEWESIRRHPISGAEIVSSFPEFASGAEYVRYHHERWDGGGYPEGLRGEEIPLGARIIAVADAFDAMTSDRPYREALSLDIVLEEFQRGAGDQWNEQVVAALLQILSQDNLQSGMVGAFSTAMA